MRSAVDWGADWCFQYQSGIRPTVNEGVGEKFWGLAHILHSMAAVECVCKSSSSNTVGADMMASTKNKKFAKFGEHNEPLKQANTVNGQRSPRWNTYHCEDTLTETE